MELKEDIKKDTMARLLVILAAIFAAIVIIYSTCWYVGITKTDDEIIISETEELSSFDVYADSGVGHGYGIVKRQKDMGSSQYTGTEPLKIVKIKTINKDTGETIYMNYHFSSELVAKTEFQTFKKDFEHVTIKDNVVTAVVK